MEQPKGIDFKVLYKEDETFDGAIESLIDKILKYYSITKIKVHIKHYEDSRFGHRYIEVFLENLNNDILDKLKGDSINGN